MVDVQVQSKTLQSLLQVKWLALRHNLSIGMQAINDQPFGDGRDLIYKKGDGVRDPLKREEGPHLKGKALKGRIKSTKWDSSTISLPNNIHLIVSRRFQHTKLLLHFEKTYRKRFSVGFHIKTCAGSARSKNYNLPLAWESSGEKNVGPEF